MDANQLQPPPQKPVAAAVAPPDLPPPTCRRHPTLRTRRSNRRALTHLGHVLPLLPDQ